MIGLVIMYTARLGFSTIVYMADGLFLIFIFTTIILFNLFVPNINLDMLPSFIHYHDPGIAMENSIVVLAWIGEWFLLFFVAPDLKIEAKMFKPLAFAGLFSLGIILIFWALTMMSFGPHLIQELHNPFLEMIRSSRQGNLLSNSDPILIGLWSASMFIHSAFLIYVASKCVASLINKKNTQIFIPFLTIASITIAFLYSRQLGTYYRHFNHFDIVIIWLIIECIPIYYGVIAFFRYRNKTTK